MSCVFLRNITMKLNVKYLLILLLIIGTRSLAQTNDTIYLVMYDSIETRIHIDNVYVSYYTIEIDYSIFDIWKTMDQTFVPTANPYRVPKVRSSKVLRTTFPTIEKNIHSMKPCSNLVYFSVFDNDFVRADVYMCVEKLRDKKHFPLFGNYDSCYSFLFKIEDANIRVVQQVHLYDL